MTENEAIIKTCELIDEVVAMYGFDIPVVQNYQPTQQGIADRSVYVELINRTTRGWAHTQFDHLPAERAFGEKESQLVQFDLQIMVLSPKDPEQPDLPTAMDIAQKARDFLQSRNVIRRLQAEGIGILRSPDVYNPKFENDREQFQAHPNFTFSLTGKTEIEFKGPAVYEGEWDFIEAI